MTPPTSEELQRAYDGITADGPASSGTLHLAALAMTDPVLKSWLATVRERAFGLNYEVKLDAVLADGILNAALIYGLNLGLRIGEARAKRSGVAS